MLNPNLFLLKSCWLVKSQLFTVTSSIFPQWNPAFSYAVKNPAFFTLNQSPIFLTVKSPKNIHCVAFNRDSRWKWLNIHPMFHGETSTIFSYFCVLVKSNNVFRQETKLQRPRKGWRIFVTEVWMKICIRLMMKAFSLYILFKYIYIYNLYTLYIYIYISLNGNTTYFHQIVRVNMVGVLIFQWQPEDLWEDLFTKTRRKKINRHIFSTSPVFFRSDEENHFW